MSDENLKVAIPSSDRYKKQTLGRLVEPRACFFPAFCCGLVGGGHAKINQLSLFLNCDPYGRLDGLEVVGYMQHWPWGPQPRTAPREDRTRTTPTTTTTNDDN